MTTVTPHGTTRMRVLRAFRDFTDSHSGIPPTVRELGVLVGVKSTSEGRRYIQQLADTLMVADQFPDFVSATPGAGGPSRRYAITSLGRQALEEAKP